MRLIGAREFDAVGVLHVRPHFEHVHAAVAVERHADRILDVGIGQHRLDLEAVRQQEQLLLLLGREPHDGRARQKVGARIGIAAARGLSAGRRAVCGA